MSTCKRVCFVFPPLNTKCTVLILPHSRKRVHDVLWNIVRVSGSPGKWTPCALTGGGTGLDGTQTGSETPAVVWLGRVCAWFPSIVKQTESGMNEDRDRPRSSLSSSPLWSRWTRRDLYAWLRFISCAAESREGDTGDVMRTCVCVCECERWGRTTRALEGFSSSWSADVFLRLNRRIRHMLFPSEGRKNSGSERVRERERDGDRKSKTDEAKSLDTDQTWAPR